MEPQQIVFVRGTGRCGSKTLAAQLGLHPAIARVPANQCLPEELIDWSHYHVRRSCSGTTDESLAAACRAYFEAWARTLAAKSGILLHKSTANVHRLASLLEYWPDAKIIYLVRHPLGVVAAHVAVDIFEYRGAYGYEATVTNSLLRWYNDVQAYLRSPVFGHPRVLQVRFEEMVTRTDRFFERIYRFLDIDDTLRHALPGPEEYEKEFVLNPRERRWIIDGTRDVVRRLGYNPDDWDMEVPAGLAHLADRYPQRRLGSLPPALDGVELVNLAAARAAAEGYRRIGLLGAGYLGHLVAPYLNRGARDRGQPMPAEIVCFFDENPVLVGNDLEGLPICRPEQAHQMRVGAVIPVTMVHQAKLIDRWNRLTGGDPPILPLWEAELIETARV